MNQLAIIIPAYKPTYLRKTLNSIANQKDKRFRVYIGDDCSPYDLHSIINEFSDKLPIIYHRFEENIGGKDLVTHWERCIALSANEKYIWLFSDDDLMEPDCVGAFYSNIDSLHDVYRFDVSVIDTNNNKIAEMSAPENITCRDFYIRKIANNLNCYAVEFIFSRKIYESTGHFVNFDLAWGSDLATWINMGFDHGIKMIKGPKIQWRSSDINISSILSKEMVMRKSNALGEFFKWADERFSNDSEIRQINKTGLLHRLTSLTVNSCHKDGINAINVYSQTTSERISLYMRYSLLFFAKRLRNVLQRRHS